VYGQSYYPNFYQYTTVDGLPSSQIYQIIQTKNNHIWFGTDGGVVHYDGYNFEVLTINDGLVSNVVFYLDEAPDGSIWFYHSDHLLSFYKSGKIYPFRYNYLLKKTTTKDFKNPLSLDVSKEGIKIYAGVVNANAKRYLKISQQQTTYNTNLKKDKNLNHIEIWTSENEDLQISSFIRMKDSTAVYLDNRFVGVVTDADYEMPKISRSTKIGTKIYFNIYHDMFILEGDSIVKQGRFPAGILEIGQRNDEDILIGTSDGLWILPQGKMDKKQQWLDDKLISSVCEDNEGGLWIGTLLSGLYYLPPNYSSTFLNKKTNPITHIQGFKDGICYANREKKVFINNGNEVTSIDLFDSPTTIQSFLVLRNDKLFASGNINETYIIDLKDLNKSSVKFEADHSFVKACYHNNEIVGVYKSSIEKWTSTTNVFSSKERIRTKDNFFYCIDSLNPTQVIAGGKIGSFIYENGMIHPFRHDLDFLRTPIRDQLVINDSLIILASQNEGIMILSNDQPFHLTKKDGLISNDIRFLAKGSNYFVAGSHKGLNIIHKDGKITSLTKKTGLSGNAINDIYCRNDTIWMATSEDIEQVVLSKNSQYSNHIEANRFFIDGAPLIKNQNFSLEYDQNEIRFDLETFSPAQQGELYYRYQLEGYDNGWQYTTERSIHYSNLPPGDYTFYASYQQPNGIWLNNQQLFSLHKEKPWWLKFWFIGSLFLLLILLTTLIIVLRNKRFRRKALEKYNLLDLERKALQSQLNPHFIFNALMSIQNLLEQNKKEESADYLVKFALLTRLSLNHSTRIYVPLSDEINLIKNYVELEQLRFKDIFSFELINLPQSDEILIPPTIIQPFVENAIIHGLIPKKNSDRKITLEFKYRDHETLFCTVDDNGVGLNHKNSGNHKGESHGIRLIAERLKILLPSDIDAIKITDKKDQHSTGVKVEIIIPYTTYENSNS
jgi:ligand-binding sensor domain-containing protein